MNVYGADLREVSCKGFQRLARAGSHKGHEDWHKDHEGTVIQPKIFGFMTSCYRKQVKSNGQEISLWSLWVLCSLCGNPRWTRCHLFLCGWGKTIISACCYQDDRSGAHPVSGQLWVVNGGSAIRKLTHHSRLTTHGFSLSFKNNHNQN